MSATYFSCHEGVGEGKEQTCILICASVGNTEFFETEILMQIFS